jgi:predicted PurR-regulated permease PerM
MPSVLSVAPEATDTIVIPLLVTIIAATVLLTVVAIRVRRLRRRGRLGVLSGGASAFSAALVLAIALFVSVSLGNASLAAAQAPGPQQPTGQTPAATQLPATNDLDGLQLPTE